MRVLAYLLSAPLPALLEDSSHHGNPRILLGGRRTDEGDEEFLQRCSNILLGLPKEATFDVLHKTLPFEWDDEERYDTINPFGDRRDIDYHALWTFDTQNDVLRYTNHDSCRQISLITLRERVVNFADMVLLGEPVQSLSKPKFDSKMLYWKPQAKVDARLRAFIHPLLRTFNHQWRHILRDRYNSVTLRALARAIIRLSTLDFEVRENTGGHRLRGLHVWITHSPAWEPYDTDVIHVGNVHVVLCQTIQDGLSTVRQQAVSNDFSPPESSSKTDLGQVEARYMVLSVKHIMLCCATGPGSLKYTAPEPLFNGDDSTRPPSDLALDYLIWATASARPAINTSLQSLPIEVQDMILNSVSVGTVQAAKVGCLLGIGSQYLWRDGSLYVTLAERYLLRPPGVPAESHVWFSEKKSGIVYLAQNSQKWWALAFPLFDTKFKIL